MMSEPREYDITVRKDSTIPEHRDIVISRLRTVFQRLPNGAPDQRAACYLSGWRLGLLLGEYIGQRDSDDIKELLPGVSPHIIEGIPFGHHEVVHPEVDALDDDIFPGPVWFGDWMGIKNEQYYYGRKGKPIPELETLCWLGYLRGSLETGSITQENYETLLALLPPVQDDFTHLVAATL